MIAYDLRCEHDHVFEGWFKDAATFEKQAKRGLVGCTVCGSTKIKRALSAPAIAGTRSQNAASPGAAPSSAPPPAEASEPAAPRASAGYATHPEAEKIGELMRQLGELRKRIEQNADYVGGRFAEEARKIHYGEVDKRNIYGEATDQEASALSEEGVEFARIPWVRRADS